MLNTKYIIGYTTDDGKSYTAAWYGNSKEDVKESFELWTLYKVDYVEEYKQ